MERCQLYVPILLLLGVLASAHADDTHTAEPADPATREIDSGFDRPASDPSLDRLPAFDSKRDGLAAAPFTGSDVVVVIDHSTLSLVASGIDVDQDGVVGRNRIEVKERRGLLMPARFWTTDSGDTLHALQLRVAQALVERLAARRNRVGLTSFTVHVRRDDTTLSRFTDGPEVIVPVGAPDAVLAALASFPPAHEKRRTDLGRLLARAAQLLDVAASKDRARRPRAILLLYLGEPSAPDGIHWSSRQALERADELGERGIAVWAVPLLPGPSRYLEELTHRSGGRVVPLDELDASFGTL